MESALGAVGDPTLASAHTHVLLLRSLSASGGSDGPFTALVSVACGTPDNVACIFDATFVFPATALFLWQLPFLLVKAQAVSPAYIPFEALRGYWPFAFIALISLVKAVLFAGPAAYLFSVGHGSRVGLGTALAAFSGAAVWTLHSIVLCRRRARTEPLPDYLLWWYVLVLGAEAATAAHRAVELRDFPDDHDLRMLDVASIVGAGLAGVVAIPAVVVLLPTLLCCCRSSRFFSWRSKRTRGVYARETGSDSTAASAALSSPEKGTSASRPSLSSPLLGRPDAPSDTPSSAPFDEAPLLSRITFWWMNALMARGYKRPLEMTDVPRLSWEDEVAQVSAGFKSAWASVAGHRRRSSSSAGSSRCGGWGRRSRTGTIEQPPDGVGASSGCSWPCRARSSATSYVISDGDATRSGAALPAQPPLSRVLFVAFGSTFGAALLFKLSFDTLQFSGPVLLSGIISFLQDSSRNDDPPPEWIGYAYTGLLLLSSLVQTSILHAYFFRSFRAGQQMRSAVIASVYEKALRLSLTARQGQSVGTITNLMSTDAKRLQDLSSYLLTIISGPYQIALAVVLLYQQIGVSVMGGVAVILLFIPLNAVIARWSKTLQTSLMKMKDSRVSLTNEALMGIRLIKLNGWEDTFLERIGAIRSKELGRLIIYTGVQQISNVLWNGLPLLVMLAAFAMYTLLNGAPPSASALFTSVALFNLLRFPMTMIPQVINNVVEAQISVRRLEAFYAAEELDPDAVLHLPVATTGEHSRLSSAQSRESVVMARIREDGGGGSSEEEEQQGLMGARAANYSSKGSGNGSGSAGGGRGGLLASFNNASRFVPVRLLPSFSFASQARGGGREESRLDCVLDPLAISLEEDAAGDAAAFQQAPPSNEAPRRLYGATAEAQPSSSPTFAAENGAPDQHKLSWRRLQQQQRRLDDVQPHPERRVPRTVSIYVEGGSFCWVSPASAEKAAAAAAAAKRDDKSTTSRWLCCRRASSSAVTKAPAASSVTPSSQQPAPMPSAAAAAATASSAPRVILSDVSFAVPTGALCFVVGAVGSGKSSLCHALLGEMHRSSGLVAVRGRVAYVPQQPFILNATLRENIVFGRPWDVDRYAATISACALGPDIAILDAGDETEIGEKGINLSGGQKARVGLARAVYSDADVYIIDDALSAVDAHVGSTIFNQCFTQMLAGRTRFIVTHGLQYVRGASDILVLRDGRIVEQGSYGELVEQSRGPFLCSLMNTYHVETVQSLNTATSAASASAKSAATAAAASAPSSPPLAGTPSGMTSKGAALALAASSAPVPSSFPSTTGSAPPSDAVAVPVASARTAPLKKKSSLSAKKGATASSKGTTTATSDDSDERQPLASGNSSGSNKPDSSGGAGSGGGGFGVLSLIRNLAKGSQTTVETRVRGNVQASVYKAYIHAIGGWPVAITILLLFVAFQGASIGTSAYLSYWDSQAVGTRDENMRYLYVYAGISFGSLAVLIVLRYFAMFAGIRAARIMHDSLLHAVIHTPASFIDTTPIGRILNRCSQDVYVIDEQFPSTLSTFIGTLLSVVGTVVLIGVVTPYFLVGVLPMVGVYIYIQRYYVATSRELQRLDSISRSPMYAHFSETLQGTPVIRAFGDAARFIAKNARMLDTNQRAYFANTSANRWLAVRLETLGAIVVSSSALFAVLGRSSSDPAFPALAGLSISTALAVTQTLNWLTRMISDCEVQAVSVERVQEYSQLAVEREIPEDAIVPPPDWPSKGQITISDLKLKYRYSTPYVLHGVSANIRGGERVGIAGRTGAGKSSFISAFFLMADVQEGTLSIDGIDIKRVPLSTLRARLTIIPQDPVLFSGTLRSNVDVLAQHTDAKVWNALSLVSMADAVRALPKQLDAPVSDGGSNFSAGQRQLLTVARALLRNSRVVILDEASSSVDALSDKALQSAIRSQFAKSTVLTIAHRVHTILDSDRVMILRDGRIAEFDAPAVLLAREGSEFASLVRDSSQGTASAASNSSAGEGSGGGSSRQGFAGSPLPPA